jgi:hypothetical protein
MSDEVGLTLDERIRRELPPLGGALRIDAFLEIMTKERARVVAASANAARSDEPSTLRRPSPRSILSPRARRHRRRIWPTRGRSERRSTPSCTGTIARTPATTRWRTTWISWARPDSTRTSSPSKAPASPC